MLLISHGANVNVQNQSYGSAPLMLAVECSDLEMVKFLVEKGADVNIKNNAGMTALIPAAWKNDAKITEALIDAGVEIDAESNEGGPAL